MPFSRQATAWLTPLLFPLLAACSTAGGHDPDPAAAAHDPRRGGLLASMTADYNFSLAAPADGQAESISTAPLPRPLGSVIIRGVERARLPGRPGKPATAATAGDIQLNFDKASLRTVVDAILGDALGVAYTVDQRIQGTVTLVSPRPVSRDEALDILDALLHLNGATLIKGDSLYRVVLTANARQGADGPQPATQPVPGFAVSVYVPRYVSAASLQKLIDPLYQIAGALQSDPQHNLLLITGGSDERRTFLEAARMFDQDWLASQSVGIFPLSQATPKAVIEDLTSIFNEQGAQTPLRFSPIERLNAVMVVSLQASVLDKVAAWINRLDQTGAGERNLHVYTVQNGKAANLASLLTRLFGRGGNESLSGNSSVLPSGTQGGKIASGGSGNGGTSSGSGGSTSGTGGIGGMSGGSSSSSSSGGSSSSTGGSLFPAESSLGKSDSGSDSGGEADSGNGPRIIADKVNNALLIMATAPEYRLIEESLAKLDIKPAQVLIEATIAEVTLTDELHYGVQYYLKGRAFRQNDSSLGFSTATAAGAITGTFPGFNAILGSATSPSVVLSALDKITDVKVISSPQVVVVDAHEAVLEVGTKVPLLVSQAVSTVTSSAATVNSVEYHDTGVILRVLPHINSRGVVSMEVVQEVSNVVASASDPLTPDIDQRRISSTVAVPSGQTVVLGGLISENAQATRSGIPLLSTLPWIGALFGDRDISKTRQELIVFITPRVVRDADDSRRLTEELMGRLQSMQPPPLPVPPSASPPEQP